MKQPLVSVVVPVYNVDRYLDRCVESIVGQTYENLEIILVDDGSSDRSGALCDEWARKDARIEVIHKQNGGLSDARNEGVKVATGDLVGFVDSDDYISIDMYEVLVGLLLEKGADISICGVADVYPDRTEYPKAAAVSVMASDAVLADIFLNKTLMVGVPPRLYPAWLVKEVPFPVGKTHEDAFVVVDLFMRVNRVAVDTTPRYFYWHNEGTITAKPSTRALNDNIDAWERNRILVEEHYPHLRDDVLFRCYWAHFDVLDGLILGSGASEGAERKREIVGYLRENKQGILSHSHVSGKRKLGLRLLLVHEFLYRLLVFAQDKKTKLN